MISPSLRARIVLLTTFFMIVILLILYFALNFLFSTSLMNAIDDDIKSSAEFVKRRLRFDDSGNLDIFTQVEIALAVKSTGNLRYVIWDAENQRQLKRTGNLVAVETRVPQFNDNSLANISNYSFAGTLYRVYNELFTSELHSGKQNLVIQVLHPLDDWQAEVSRLNNMFYLVTPLPVLLLVIGGWWIAGRALRPVRQFITELNSINASKLNERLSVVRKDEIGELAASFNIMLDRIENTFQSLKRFTADASHQLRTPLTSIKSQSEIALSRDRDKHAYREAFSNVLEEVDHLLRLSESLLQLARSDAGLVELSVSMLDVSALLEEWVENLAPLAEEKSITIDREIEPGIFYQSDPVLMETIMVNLLENAINYTPESGKIVVTLGRVNDGLKLDVCDTGPGIPEEDKSRIFERFVRLGKTRGTVYGSGLGLAIVKAAVNVHKGMISVSNSKQGGSCFEVCLPILNKTSG